MRMRRLGTTGLEVSELALGTWGLSGDGYGPVDASERDAVLERALRYGITLFETADCYGSGEMEAAFSRLLPAEACVVTKVGTDREGKPARKRFDAAFVRESVERSSERLKRAPTVVLLHGPSRVALESGEATGTLRELAAAGQLKAWGVSAGDATTAKLALDAGAGVISLAYNTFHTGDLRALLAHLVVREVGLLAHSVLSYGLLCGYWARDRRFAPTDHRRHRWTADELRLRVGQLDALRSVVGGPIVSLRSVALRFVLRNERVSSAVLGPRTTLQLDQLVREATAEPPYLDDERFIKLETRLRDVGAVQ